MRIILRILGPTDTELLNLRPQAFTQAPDSTPALPQIEEKGRKTAGVGSSVARSDRSVSQARLLLFCFPCFFGTASRCQPILSQAFAEAAPDSTPALLQMEAKGTKTAGVGSSVARSDRSVPQARGCDDIHPGVLNATPVCSSCAAVHVCVE